MAGRRVTRQSQNAIPPPVEGVNHEEANPTNLPPPPTELTTVVMNLAQQVQQIQATLGMMLQAGQGTPPPAGPANATPEGNHPAPQPHIAQQPAAVQGNFPYPQPLYGVYPPGQMDQSRMVERFLKMKPKEFNGKQYGTLWPAQWVDEMERNFRMMTVTEEEKVLCATFMLKGDAHQWWGATEGYLLTKHAQLNWAVFKEAFFEKYFPQSFRDNMEKEFLSLYQGQMTVDAYQQRFEELFFFAPLSLKEETSKARRFVLGLRGSIRELIVGLEKKIYNEAVQVARVVESSQRESFNFHNRGTKRTAGNGYNGGNSKSYKPFRPQGPAAPVKYNPQQQSKPTYEGPKCFNCGQPGHMMKECPKPKKTTQQGRVYAVTSEEAAASPDVVTGMN